MTLTPRQHLEFYALLSEAEQAFLKANGWTIDDLRTVHKVGGWVQPKEQLENTTRRVLTHGHAVNSQKKRDRENHERDLPYNEGAAMALRMAEISYLLSSEFSMKLGHADYWTEPDGHRRELHHDKAVNSQKARDQFYEQYPGLAGEPEKKETQA